MLEALSEGGVNAAQAEALCDARVPDGVRADLVAAGGQKPEDLKRSAAYEELPASSYNPASGAHSKIC